MLVIGGGFVKFRETRNRFFVRGVVVYFETIIEK